MRLLGADQTSHSEMIDVGLWVVYLFPVFSGQKVLMRQSFSRTLPVAYFA